jgi:uncharacterized MAPEG superfamily protein
VATAYWCILIAGILPYLTVFVAKGHPGYDNRDPRGWLAAQQGFRQRADYAHRNHFEAFPFFAASVFCAEFTGGRGELTDTLALVFIGARLLYTAFYLFDQALLRTTAFMVAIGCCVALFVSAPLGL